MVKCYLFLVPALIVAAGSGTISAPAAAKPVEGTVPNLDPATQPDIGSKRMLRVTDAATEFAGEEKGPGGVAGSNGTKTRKQPPLYKTTTDPEARVSELFGSWVAKWAKGFGQTLASERLKLSEKEAEAAKKFIARNANNEELFADRAKNEAVKKAVADQPNVHPPSAAGQRSNSFWEVFEMTPGL